MTWNFGMGIGKYRFFSNIQSPAPLVRIVECLPRSFLFESHFIRTRDRRELERRLEQTRRLLYVADATTTERLKKLAEEIDAELASSLIERGTKAAE
jgi:hypothetical protein